MTILFSQGQSVFPTLVADVLGINLVVGHFGGLLISEGFEDIVGSLVVVLMIHTIHLIMGRIGIVEEVGGL